MKPLYCIIRITSSPKDYYVIKRISGGTVSSGKTITQYEILYPQNISKEKKRKLHYYIKGDGRSRLATSFNSKKFHTRVKGIIKEILE